MPKVFVEINESIWHEFFVEVSDEEYAAIERLSSGENHVQDDLYTYDLIIERCYETEDFGNGEVGSVTDRIEVIK